MEMGELQPATQIRYGAIMAMAGIPCRHRISDRAFVATCYDNPVRLVLLV
jgi:hypothetical protein